MQRVYLVSDAKAFGKIALDSADWSSRLGQTWADAALPARALLDDYDQSGPAMASVRLIAGGAAADGGSAQAATHPRVGDSVNRFDIMAGIVSTDGPSRRLMAEADSGFGGPLDGLAQGRQVQAIFEHLETIPRRYSPAWPKATNCRRPSTLRPLPR